MSAGSQGRGGAAGNGDASREEQGEAPPLEPNEAVSLKLICEAFWKLWPTLPSNRGPAASGEHCNDEDVDLTRLSASVGEYRRIVEEVAATPARTLGDFLVKKAVVGECVNIEAMSGTSMLVLTSLFHDFDRLTAQTAERPVSAFLAFGCHQRSQIGRDDGGSDTAIVNEIDDKCLLEACEDFWSLLDRVKLMRGETGEDENGGLISWTETSPWSEWEVVTGRLGRILANTQMELIAKKRVVHKWLQFQKDFDSAPKLLASFFKDCDRVLGAANRMTQSESVSNSSL